MFHKPPSRPRPAADANSTVAALIDLDNDIMKMLARRARLVSRLRGGKEHAASPAAIQAEKTVRRAWEAGALAFSKDPRFTRQLFALLQDIKVLGKEEAESKGHFRLGPAHKPVSASITGPASGRVALLWAALAASLGKELNLTPVLLSDPVVQGVKAFSQSGARLSWEATGSGMGAINAQHGPPATFAGKTIFVGDSLLGLCLVAFDAAKAPGTCRLTGGAALKSADLSSLRHILPLIGARLAHAVPHSQGLPASLECSGVLPEAITVPADLPLDGVCALLMAPLLWGKPCCIDLANLPALVATRALAETNPVHRAVGALVKRNGSALTFTPAELVLPLCPVLPLDQALASYLLALPAFLEGDFTLVGQWPEDLPEAAEAAAILAWAGAPAQVQENSIRTACQRDGFVHTLQVPTAAPELIPLRFALAALHQHRSKTPVSCPWIADIEATDRLLGVDFLSRLGLLLEGVTIIPTIQDDQTPEHLPQAWTSPDAFWSMGLALAACFKPGLLLANPGTVSAAMPAFWSLYNGLPNPTDPLHVKKQPKREADHAQPAKPARRRIIAE